MFESVGLRLHLQLFQFNESIPNAWGPQGPKVVVCSSEFAKTIKIMLSFCSLLENPMKFMSIQQL